MAQEFEVGGKRNVTPCNHIVVLFKCCVFLAGMLTLATGMPTFNSFVLSWMMCNHASEVGTPGELRVVTEAKLAAGLSINPSELSDCLSVFYFYTFNTKDAKCGCGGFGAV